MTFESQIVLIGALSELCLLIILLVRKQWKAFPLFTTFICWAVLSDFATILFHVSFSEKLVVYIAEFSLDSAFQSFVLFELAWSVFKPVRTLLPKRTLWISLVVYSCISVGCWYLAGFTVPDNLSRHGYLLVEMQQTIALLRVVFFMVLVAFSQFFSIGWRDRELQIASGLGFYSILSLVVSVLHTHQAVGPQYHWLDLVTSFGYLGTLTYWVVSFAQKEPEVRKISPQMMRFLVSIGGSLQADRLALETAVKKKPGKYTHR